METKRCQRCHKLLRAEAQTCSRCGGYDFLPVSQAKPHHPGVLLSDETTSTPPRTTRSVGSPLSPLPPVPTQLSPHRAGHYSGLHPEDEPYQSSFLPVQRLPLSEQPALDIEEVEDLAYSTVPDMPGAPLPAPAPTPAVAPPQKRRVASLTPLPQPRQQRSAQTLRAPAPSSNDIERDREVVHAYVDAPTLPAPRPRRSDRRQQSLAVRLLLIIAAFLFIVATGILTFLLLDSKPTVALKPQLTADAVGSLRVSDTLLLYGSHFEANATATITRDANIPVSDTHIYSTGNFVAPITIGKDWRVGPHTIYATDQQGHEASLAISVEGTQPGPPILQVSSSHVDLGDNSAGVASHTSITLSNMGGGKVIWQSSNDSPAWLKLTPPNGNFAGREEVVITVDRSNLLTKPYTGHIKFIQQGSTASPLTVTVTMGVNPPAANPASANLVISNAAFTFSGDPTTNPVAQTLTIQNTGGQSLNWVASASTTNGVNWLSLSTSSGYLAGGTSNVITVTATSAGLSVGSYSGAITFSYGGVVATPVTVTLTVNAPPVAKIAISQGGLSFHAIMGQNPLAQSFTITNTGNAPLNWGILEDATAKTYTPVSQSNGTLAPGKGIVIVVTPSIGQAGAGTLNATITVMDTDTGTPVKSQTVKVTLTIVNQAVITLDQSQMTFNHSVSQQINASTQQLMLTNTGSAPLNWSLNTSNPSPIAWLAVDTTSGTNVPPGGAAFITVTCDSTNLSPGTFQATLTFRDTDAGTPVAPQTLTVTVIVSP